MLTTFPLMLDPGHSKPYLAFDFGAESGRAVLGHLQSGILTTKEVRRFPNRPVNMAALSLGRNPSVVGSARNS